MKKVSSLFMCIFLIICLVGCGGGTSRPTLQPQDMFMRGAITSLSQQGDKMTILVEGQWEGAVSDKGSVSIDGSAEVYDAVAEKMVQIEELKVGLQVEVIFDGPILESYPIQGRAKAVTILGL
ncbi:MAG: DUF3221 domain-containing protein [Christensenellales bacterium]|jgi:beta-N-acetylhexosaminidase